MVNMMMKMVTLHWYSALIMMGMLTMMMMGRLMMMMMMGRLMRMMRRLRVVKGRRDSVVSLVMDRATRLYGEIAKSTPTSISTSSSPAA